MLKVCQSAAVEVTLQYWKAKSMGLKHKDTQETGLIIYLKKQINMTKMLCDNKDN